MSDKLVKELGVKLHNFMRMQVEVNTVHRDNINRLKLGTNGLIEVEMGRRGYFPVCMEAIR